MIIDHFILGAKSVDGAAQFYAQLFAYQPTTDNPGAKDGLIMRGSGADLVILPMAEERLPNPFHFAFRAATEEEFESILQCAIDMHLQPREAPAKTSNPGPGSFSRTQDEMGIKQTTTYRNFYINDPSGSLVEVIWAHIDAKTLS
jgi:catechol 2,3-dioxygenase-like lactoylglutathione lyase family enzyme